MPKIYGHFFRYNFQHKFQHKFRAIFPGQFHGQNAGINSGTNSGQNVWVCFWVGWKCLDNKPADVLGPFASRARESMLAKLAWSGTLAPGWSRLAFRGANPKDPSVCKGWHRFWG